MVLINIHILCDNVDMLVLLQLRIVKEYFVHNNFHKQCSNNVLYFNSYTCTMFNIIQLETSRVNQPVKQESSEQNQHIES